MSKNAATDLKHVDNPLQLNEDIGLHIKGWKIQRIAWIVIIILLVLAALGLFGTGPLSHRTVSKNGDTLKYEHFGRFQSQTELEFTVNKENGVTQVVFPQAYIDNFQIERITPLPEKTEMLHRSIVYTFDITDRGKIIFYMIPQTNGTIKGTVAVNNIVFDLLQYIYP
jgi:hypothetical protein